MEDRNKSELLKELIDVSKENMLETKFGDIFNNINNKSTEKKYKHQKCNTSIFDEEHANQILKDIGDLDKITENVSEQEIDESFSNKSHSKHNTEAYDLSRYTNFNKNINEYQINDRKTVEFDNNYVVEHGDNEESDNDEDENMDDLGNILGMKLEKFDKENGGLILNEQSNNLIDNLKTENLKKYIQTGTKIDFAEEIEGKIFRTKRSFKDLEKYISNNDENNKEFPKEVQSILSSNKKLAKRIIYNMLSPKNCKKLFEELTKNEGVIFVFDKNNNVIFGTKKGSISIYNLNEEKKLKELDNPFKDDSKNKLSTISALSTDEKYIICAYNNGKIALYRKGRDKINKTKLFMTIKEIFSKDIITEIRVYSGKKDRIIFYFVDKNGKLFRVKIYKGMFKKKMTYKNLIINSYNDYKYYNLQINPNSYKCYGISNSNGIYIYNVKKNDNKLLFNKIKKIASPFNPNFCFIYSSNVKEKSKFMASITPDSVCLYEINSNFTNAIQISKYMIKDPIIKIGVFINELVYIIDKGNQITLINCSSETHKITQKFMNNEENINLSDLGNFKQLHYENLVLYNNIICNKNRNIIINSIRKTLLIAPLTLKECINKICNQKDNDKWSILFYLCNQVYKNKHPIWTRKDYEECSNLIIEKVNICIKEIINTNSNEKMDQLETVIEFLFITGQYDYITSEKDGLYSSLKDDKIYFYLLEPHILQNKFKSINLPIIFINKMIDFYVKINKKSWLCELLIHFDIKLLCDKNSANKNGVSLIDYFDKNNLINILIYIILKNYDIYKDYSYYSPIISILVNLIKESKDKQLGETINRFRQILSDTKEYNQIKEVNENDNKENIEKDGEEDNKENIEESQEINSSENDDKTNFIDLNRYNDELLYSNYYLRIKFLWYIYITISCKKIDENNKKKVQEIINKSLEIILNPKVYEILELDDGNKEILNLEREIGFIINKIFKDENINEFCEINKEDILNKIEKLVKKKYISQMEYYLICLRAFLDDSTLEINKETKLNIILCFMNNNLDNNKNKNEIKSEKFEQDLIELLKNIDSFTFDDTDKIINASNNCKDNYPKLCEYIINNFKK